jgi:hypothetical protein
LASAEGAQERRADGKLLLLAAFGTEPQNGSFAVLKVVFDLQTHDGTDPAASVGKGGKQDFVPVPVASLVLIESKSNLTSSRAKHRHFIFLT